MRKAIVIAGLCLLISVPDVLAKGWDMTCGLGIGGLTVNYPKIVKDTSPPGYIVVTEETGFVGGMGYMQLNYFFGEKFGLGFRGYGHSYVREESADWGSASASFDTTIKPVGGAIIGTLRLTEGSPRPYLYFGLGGYQADIVTTFSYSFGGWESDPVSVTDEDEGAVATLGGGVDFMVNDNWHLGLALDINAFTSDDDDDTTASSAGLICNFGYSWK